MKRYIMFAGETYYPSPGWIGFVKDFKTKKEITEDLKTEITRDFDWWHVVDLKTGEIIMGAGIGYSQGYVKAFPNSKEEE